VVSSGQLTATTTDKVEAMVEVEEISELVLTEVATRDLVAGTREAASTAREEADHVATHAVHHAVSRAVQARAVDHTARVVVHRVMIEEVTVTAMIHVNALANAGYSIIILFS